MRIIRKFMWFWLFSLSVWSAKFYYITANQQIITNGLVNCSAAAAATTINATNECPLNSICSGEVISANITAYRCKCLAPYELNPAYNNHSSENSSNGTASYCLQIVTNRIYVRQPAKVEHLAFGILLVLFVVIAVVVLLYLLKISRPIKRSKAAYTRLKRRREHRRRLEEFNDDDISMIQLNENQKR